MDIRLHPPTCSVHVVDLDHDDDSVVFSDASDVILVKNQNNENDTTSEIDDSHNTSLGGITDRQVF